MAGKLYGVSVGPGDPELLTLKAVRVLREVDVVAAPNVGGGDQTALGIVAEHVAGKELLDCSTPMSRDREVTARAYERIADEVCALLDTGKDVAFITLGDATVYSTYFYVHERVTARGYEAEVVPGVTSFCAAAARLGTPLCEADDQLLVVPAGRSSISDALDIPGVKVFMKSGKAFSQLRGELDKRGLLESAQMVQRCGLEGERVYRSLADADDESGYLSVAILRDKFRGKQA